MNNVRIIRLICFEGMFIGIIGGLIGIIIGGVASYYYSINGIVLGGSMENLMGEIDIGDTLYTKLELFDILISGITGIIIGIKKVLLVIYI